MGRSLVAEETVREQIENLFSTVNSSQCGLVIGQRAANKDFIALLVPTPCDGSDDETPCVEWCVLHAMQVERMLPAGFEVLGLFLYCAPSTAQRLQGQVRQLAYELCRANTLDRSVCRWTAGTELGAAHAGDAVVVQVCSATKRTACRTLDVHDRQATLKPAELKYQAFLRGWTEVRCTYALDEVLFVDGSAAEGSPPAAVLANLGEAAACLSRAAAAVVSDRGRLFRKPEDPLVPRSSGGHSAAASRPAVQLELWSDDRAAASDAPAAAPTPRSCQACLQVRGDVCARAYLHDRATVRDAVGLLKLDILRSVAARLQLLSEDEQDEELDADGLAAKSPSKASSPPSKAKRSQRALVCPRRCFALVDGPSPIALCDYMFPGEEASTSVERMAEMLSVSVKGDSCVQPEAMPSSQAEALQIVRPSTTSAPGPYSVAAPESNVEDVEPMKVSPRGSSCTTIVGAVFVAALAGISSWVLSAYS